MRKYYLSARFKYLYMTIGLVFSLPIFGIFVYLSRNTFFLLPWLVLSILVMIRAIYWIQNESITVLEKGIEYDTPGIVLETQWKNIEQVSYRWRNLIKQEGLIVDKSNFRILREAIYGNSYSPASFDYQKVFIPIACFSENWRESELGQQIKQYAPHLFPGKISEA